MKHGCYSEFAETRFHRKELTNYLVASLHAWIQHHDVSAAPVHFYTVAVGAPHIQAFCPRMNKSHAPIPKNDFQNEDMHLNLLWVSAGTHVKETYMLIVSFPLLFLPRCIIITIAIVISWAIVCSYFLSNINIVVRGCARFVYFSARRMTV